MTGRGWLQVSNMILSVRGNGTPFINRDSVVGKSEASTMCASLEIVQPGPTARRELVERLFIVIWTFFRTRFGSRLTWFSDINLKIKYGPATEFAYAQPKGTGAQIVFFIDNHSSMADVLSTLVHEMAHVFEGLTDGHGSRFFKTYLAMLTVLKCRTLDLSDFGIRRIDVECLGATQFGDEPTIYRETENEN